MPAAPPDSPVPAPRGHDRDVELAGDPDQLGDLCGRRREDDGTRQPGVEIGGLVDSIALAVGRRPSAGEGPAAVR